MSKKIKPCNKCHENKSLDCFGIDKQKSDGLHSYCKQCRLMSRKANRDEANAKAVVYRKKNKKEISIKRKKNYLINAEFIKRIAKDSYSKRMITHSSHVNELKKQWKDNNKDKVKQYWKKHYAKNKFFYIEKAIFRYRAVKQAKLIGFDKQIKLIYDNCPPGYQVDHIIPLNNPMVCGLHVPWNLQYLTVKENLKKSNKV